MGRFQRCIIYRWILYIYKLFQIIHKDVPALHDAPILYTDPKTNSYTGVINPIYDIKLPRDKFSVKRTKSLGRSFSSRSVGVDGTRHNLSVGQRAGRRTNDVVTAMNGTSAETALEVKGHFLQRHNTNSVVGDSYKITRVTID